LFSILVPGDVKHQAIPIGVSPASPEDGFAVSDKFNIYDLLASVVPGTLIICLVAVAVPDLAASARDLKMPDAFAVIALVALALFVGNVVQAVASLLDPLLFRLWGGRPSERCLQHGLGDRYMPKDTADRIRGKLVAAVGGAPTDRSLFLFAMQQAESASPQRVTTFNALFAYHRALLVVALVAVPLGVALVCGQGPVAWTPALRWGFLVGAVLLLALFFYRTRQRAFYYVRELLLTAERVLDQKPPPAAAPATGTP
jgi:hypothetical protein